MASAKPTGKQVDYLLALGVEMPIHATRSDASALIDKAKEGLKERPSRAQRRFAKTWDLDFSKVKNGYDAVEILMTHIQARRWVYSVCRRQAAATWRYYSESGLDESKINELARWFSSIPAFMEMIADRGVGETTSGDAWYRLTDSWCARSEPYLMTAKKVFDRFGPSMAAPKAPTSRNRRSSKLSKEKGCLLMLAYPLAIVVPGVALLVRIVLQS